MNLNSGVYRKMQLNMAENKCIFCK